MSQSTWTPKTIQGYIWNHRNERDFVDNMTKHFLIECTHGTREIANIMYHGVHPHTADDRYQFDSWLLDGLHVACESNNLEIFNWILSDSRLRKKLMGSKKPIGDSPHAEGDFSDRVKTLHDKVFVSACHTGALDVTDAIEYEVTNEGIMVGIIHACNQQNDDILDNVGYRFGSIKYRDTKLFRKCLQMGTINMANVKTHPLATFLSNLTEKAIGVLNRISKIYVLNMVWELPPSARYAILSPHVLQEYIKYLIREKRFGAILEILVQILRVPKANVPLDFRIESSWEDRAHGVVKTIFSSTTSSNVVANSVTTAVYSHAINIGTANRLIDSTRKYWTLPPMLNIDRVVDATGTAEKTVPIVIGATKIGVTITTDSIIASNSNHANGNSFFRMIIRHEAIGVAREYKKMLDNMCRMALLVVFLRRVSLRYSKAAILKKPIYV